MKKTKKILALTLALLLSMSLISCGQKAEPSSPAPEPSSAQQTAAPEAAENPAENEISAPDGYPSKNVSWIVPAAAGSATDLPTRVAADMMNLGKPVVVENIAGASTTLGAGEAVARDADGHTMLSIANATISQAILGTASYTMEDLRVIASLTPLTAAATIAVKSDSSLETLDDFQELIKSGDYVVGVPNTGGLGHLAICSVLTQLGVYEDATMMVYNGGPGNIAALLNGEVDFAIVDNTDVKAHSEEMRAIAILHDKENDLLPGVPAITDIGCTDMSSYVGLKLVAVRSDTPDDIVEYIKKELYAALNSEEYNEYMVTMGYGPMPEFDETDVQGIVDTAENDFKTVMEAIGML